VKRCPSEVERTVGVVRCTREEGHTMDEQAHDLHCWLRPGIKIKWPDSAALPLKGGGVS